MARPFKTGIDYFPHSCATQTEMEILEAKCGIVGYAVINKLYERIYASDGYFCKWSDNIEIVFAKNIGVDLECIRKVIEVAFENEIFSKEMFDRYKILTSKEIQEIYIEVTKKRKKIVFVKEFMLVENCGQTVNDNHNSINDNHNSINDAHNTQSKVEESRGNKSKENERKENQIKVEESREEESKENDYSQINSKIKIPCVDGTYIVNEGQLHLLQQLYEEINVSKCLRKLADYMSSHPDRQRKLDNMQNRLIQWLDEDNEKAINEAKRLEEEKQKQKQKQEKEQEPKEEYIKGVDYF